MRLRVLGATGFRTSMGSQGARSSGFTRVKNVLRPGLRV